MPGRMLRALIVRHLNASDLGKTVTLPTLAASAGAVAAHSTPSPSKPPPTPATVRIGDHLHSVPNDATVYVTTEVSGL